MLSKMVVSSPTTTTMDSTELGKLYSDHVYRRYGIPQRLITDRRSVYTSNFWRTLTSLSGTETSSSTAYHPQTDGQTEIVNQRLEQYLRMNVKYEQDNWGELLHEAEFCHNSTTHSAAGLAPFECLYGFVPRNSMAQPLDPLPELV